MAEHIDTGAGDIESSGRSRLRSFVRANASEAVTIDEPIRGFRGFRGWRYRWWKRSDERPFPDWRTP